MSFISIALLILGIFVVFVLILEGVNGVVFGKWISEKYLDKYFAKNLDAYKNGIKTGYLLHGSWNIPYIAGSHIFSSKYYIQNLGRIPRWSKWTKVLDEIVWDI